MRATGALPTEERVQKMNVVQWLWYYRNIILDEKEDNEKWQDRLDYMSWWINPKMAEGVMNMRNKTDQNNYNHKNSMDEQIENAPMGQSTINVEGNVVVNNSFEEELQKALKESGEDITVLPESGSAGNALESKDDFLARAMEMQNLFSNESLENVNKVFETSSETKDYNVENDNVENDNIDQLNHNNLPEGIDLDDIDYFEFPD